MTKKQLSILITTALVLGAVFYFRDSKQYLSQDPETTDLNEETLSKTPEPTKAESPAAPIAPAPLSEKDKARLTELREELAKAQNEFTTVEDIKKLPKKELHHTPHVLIENGKLIGRLISKAESEPFRREETLKFFLECAENSELPDSLRATCWNSTMKQIPKWKIFVPITGAKVSDEVKELATKLP